VNKKKLNKILLSEEHDQLLRSLFPELAEGPGRIAPKVVEEIQLPGRGVGLEPREWVWISPHPLRYTRQYGVTGADMQSPIPEEEA